MLGERRLRISTRSETQPSAETNNANVSVMSSEFSQANTMVMVAVGDDAAPWRCLVSSEGMVAEVSFAGGEGFL